MAWRGGVTLPHTRKLKKRPSEDERQKNPKNEKGGALESRKVAKVYLCQFKPLGRKGLRVIGKGSKGFSLTFS